MANKKCLVFETLGKIKDMNIIKESADGYMRLHGVFGVCGVRNQNKRVYNKQNYGMMVEAMQKEITAGSVLGELEHPNSMNINLENVSHMIESIEMNEDGTITGTIKLLDTPKGKIAQAIASASGSLYISSRAAGSIDESGNVTLTTLKTYDLVGTPGFSQAKLNLAKGQKFESLNESLDDGNIMYAIVEGDDLLDSADDNDDDDKKSDKKSDDSSDDKSDDKKSDNKKDDSNSDGKSDDDDNDSSKKKEEDNKNNDKDATMNDLKQAIDKLSEKIESLEADLHVAQESLSEKDEKILHLEEKLSEVATVNYGAIEQWVTEEFAPEFKNELAESFADGIQEWVCEEFAPEVQNWVCEEFAPEVQNWVCEEFAPEVQNWVCEEFAPTVEGWINEELMPTVDKWVNEECIPEHRESIVNEVNNNVSEFLESKNADRLSAIDNLLEAIETKGSDDAALDLLKEQKEQNKYKGVYVVEHMPAQYQPQWEGITEAKQQEIIRQSRMYDFTKPGIMEKFWDTVNFNEENPVNETVQQAPEANRMSAIAAQMNRLRH